MNCPICLNEMDNNDMYTIACGSNTPHQICNPCEILMRCSATPTNHGRFIQCPLCRVIEPVQGARTIESYEAELLQMYAVPVQAPRPAPQPAPRPVPTQRLRQMQWCQSGLREIGQCATKGKTKRYCSFATCWKNVCLKCKHCATH